VEDATDLFFAFSNIAIGAGAAAVADNAMAIGTGADNDSAFGIAIGDGVTLDGANGIAIGSQIIVGVEGSPSVGAIGIGGNIGPSANNAVQIGVGNNTDANTFQYLTNRLANAEGLYTSFTAPTNYTPADDDNVTSHLTAIDTALGGGGGDPYVVTNYTGTLPVATGTDSVAIGADAEATGNTGVAIGANAVNSSEESIAVGSGATVGTNCDGGVALGDATLLDNSIDGIAIGDGATVAVANGVQLGFGANSTTSTLQYLTNTIANADGLQVPVFTGTPTTSPADGSVAIDNTVASERVCYRVNGAWMCAALVPA